ncbi:MAG: secondary thiamine-phosphate synthase enzyme YjbQ [Bacteroidales bacterium]|nr:secondary thiamine-phosphate synthase enzyme YjbQ [Bacteroidales bacterium]
MIKQIEIELPEYPKGFHLITPIIKSHINGLPEKGLINILIKHTSAGLTINENADPSVRNDLESFINKLVPENESFYTHIFEGADDMPAHIKSSIFGASVTIPISNYKLNLGIWQGIYLCEFRNHGGARKLFVTIFS